MSAGPTTRAFVDKDGNTVNSIGGQNANGDYVAGHTAHDINGAPIVVALDSSVQSVVAAMSTSNAALASIQSSATALVTAAGTEITLLGEIFTVAGTLATDAHLVAQTAAIGAGNTTLAAILAKQPALSGDGGAPAHVTNFPTSFAKTSFGLTNSAPVACSASPNTALQVVPFSGTRKVLHIFNRTAGGEVVDIGSSNVVENGGIPLSPGEGYMFEGQGAAGPIYAISPVASTPLSYVEG